ncbi:MAG: hypothetical protein KAS32_10030, partial [Candidatus Peribacteraceae bacterium]|nr:hypothetical protein [Candidatus Peribacteraceae bacterium]
MCGINLCYGESNINKMNDSLADNSLRSNYVKLDNSDMYLGRVRLHAMGANKKHDQPIARGNYIGAMIGEIFNYKKIDPTAKTDLQ